MEQQFIERAKFQIKGEVWIKIGNNLTRKEILEKPDRNIKNLIVDVFSDLIAQWALVNVDNSVSGSVSDTTKHIPGILTLAVGTGAPGWDIQNPPTETADLTVLFSELIRKPFISKCYVDGNGNDLAAPVNPVSIDTFTSRLTVGVNIPTGTIITITAVSLPIPLNANYTYFAINVDANNIRLATSYSNALLGVYIPLTTAGAGVQVVAITNIIDLLTTFNNSEAVGPLVEMGLFGGVGALVANGGIRVNAKHFPVINKPAGSQMSVLYRLIF
jgi:hypothetical protein